MKSNTVFLVPSPSLFLLTYSKKSLTRHFDFGKAWEAEAQTSLIFVLVFCV